MLDLYNIFPKPVLVDTGVLSSKASAYEKRIKDLKETDQGAPRYDLTANMTFQSHAFLHEDPVFADLVDSIYRNSKFFLHKLGCDHLVDKIKITNMWAVYYTAGEFVYPHVHPSCLVSGVYYVKGNGNITFIDNIQSMIQANTTSELYKTHEEFSCSTDTMILWKSDLLHGTQQATEEKIAISFNLA
jgi:uncharacterized protein (TIGR02466 family)